MGVQVVDPAELAMQTNAPNTFTFDPAGSMDKGMQMGIAYAKNKAAMQEAQDRHQQMVQDMQMKSADGFNSMMLKGLDEGTTPAQRKIILGQAKQFGMKFGMIDPNSEDKFDDLIKGFNTDDQLRRNTIAAYADGHPTYDDIKMFSGSSMSEYMNYLKEKQQGTNQLNLASFRGQVQADVANQKSTYDQIKDTAKSIRAKAMLSPDDMKKVSDLEAQNAQLPTGEKEQRAKILGQLNQFDLQGGQPQKEANLGKTNSQIDVNNQRVQYMKTMPQLRKYQIDSMNSYRDKTIATRAINQVDQFTKGLNQNVNQLQVDLDGLLSGKKGVLKNDVYEASLNLAKSFTGSSVVTDARAHGVIFTPIETEFQGVLDKFFEGRETATIPPQEIKVLRDRFQRVIDKNKGILKQYGTKLIDERVASGAFHPEVAEQMKKINGFPSQQNLGDEAQERQRAQNAISQIRSGAVKGITEDQVRQKFKSKTGKDL